MGIFFFFFAFQNSSLRLEIFFSSLLLLGCTTVFHRRLLRARLVAVPCCWLGLYGSKLQTRQPAMSPRHRLPWCRSSPAPPLRSRNPLCRAKGQQGRRAGLPMAPNFWSVWAGSRGSGATTTAVRFGRRRDVSRRLDPDRRRPPLG